MKPIYKILMQAFLLLIVFSSENTAFAFSAIKSLPDKEITDKNLPLNYLRAAEFIKLSPRQFTAITGKRLNIFQKAFFKITKMRIKHDLKKDPDLNIKHYYRQSENGGSFNFPWFLLGMAAPLIGLFTGSILTFALVAIAPVVVAYASKQGRIKIKSAWFGFGTGILIIALLIIIVAASLGGSRWE